MKRYRYLLLTPLLLSSCGDDSMRMAGFDDGILRELSIQAEIDQINMTRADDSGFADGDVIGVYAVDFSGGRPGTLQSVGNNSDNVAFTFDEDSYKWKGTSSIRFTDEHTPMDLYGYYPYSESVDDVESYPFSVEYDQRGVSGSRNMSAYEASDFLWAKSAGVTSAEPSSILYFKHILASVCVTLVEGAGFDEGEWTGLDKTVQVCNTHRESSVNLSTGEVKPVGTKDGRSIVANEEGNDYRAVVIPQNVSAGSDLLHITVGGKTYKFRKDKDMVYNPTKKHTFTIEVTKSDSTGDYEFSLMGEAVTPWESDLTSHNGTAKEYVVVNVPESTSLKAALKNMSLDPAEIVNVKIIGKLADEDFEFIRSSMLQVESINMAEVILPDLTRFGDRGYFSNALPQNAFAGMTTLRNFVFPKGLKNIGPLAFCGTGLTGSLVIPEGVELIDEHAFRSSVDYVDYPYKNNLTGTLSLPSSLKKIGSRAFLGCEFTGKLLLPDGLKEIDEGTFKDCRYFTGDLHIPAGVKIESFWWGEGVFEGMSGLSGRIALPKDLKTLQYEMFSCSPVKSIDWPDDLMEIQDRAFNGCDFKCDVRIPETVLTIGSGCFAYSNIKHVVLPPELSKISGDCFLSCTELSDTIVIPDKVELIESRAFDHCDKLEALVLPRALTRINSGAFVNCFNLNYIYSKSKEPPYLEEDAFYGMDKHSLNLLVPEESVDAYRNAPGWSEFKRISAYRNFVAYPSKYNVLNKGGKKEIILYGESDWEMVECPSWCSIDMKTGSKKSILNLSVNALSKGSVQREGKIVFRLKDHPEYQTHITVAQYDYLYDEDEYLTLQSASKGNGINLAFIGDGYDAFDIASGKYLEDMKMEMEYFFGVEPYATYRDYFNVFTAFARSEESGVEELNTWRDTKFNVVIGDGCSAEGQRLSADWMKALDYCAENIPPTVQRPNPQVGCILVSNSEISEGVTYLGDSFCSVVTKSSEPYPDDARGLVQHEAGGHGIGWLGDEYVYRYAFINRCVCPEAHVYELENDHAMGFALNLSLTGKYQEVPWSHLIFNKEYGDIVDVYEGGYFHSRGVYRSEYNSCMNNNVPYFSTWSRELIVRRIMKLAGEPFDFDSFLAKDNRSVGSDFRETTRSGFSKNFNNGAGHGQVPIKITGYKYGQKGGKR